MQMTDVEPGSGTLGIRAVVLTADKFEDMELIVPYFRLLGRGTIQPGHLRPAGIASKTLKAHVSVIFSKLGLEPANDDNRRVLAVLRYLRAGG
jgi:hypothetical protein